MCSYPKKREKEREREEIADTVHVVIMTMKQAIKWKRFRYIAHESETV